jgi:hypothetical protein
MVTARVDLLFDPTTGIIQLNRAADGVQLRIEDDMLDAELRPEREQYATVTAQLNAIEDDVWDRQRTFTTLKAWATALHPDCEWSAELKPAIAEIAKPRVTFAPALILRKRTQIGMVRIYDVIINRVASGDEDIPAAWTGLVDANPGEHRGSRQTGRGILIHRWRRPNRFAITDNGSGRAACGLSASSLYN